MGSTDLYSIKTVGGQTDVYEVKKFSKDLEFVEAYHVSDLSPAGDAMVCTCFAGAKAKCRHRTMLRKFQSLERVNTEFFYHFDKDRWFRMDDEGVLRSAT